MEAKYYRGGDFLESRIGHQPSFAWRSIHSACDFIKEGLIWRIGNGTKTQIWKDKWIPRSSTFMIQSPPRRLDPEAKVCELLDVEKKWWDLTLLQELFTKEEVELVLSMSISTTG